MDTLIPLKILLCAQTCHRVVYLKAMWSFIHALILTIRICFPVLSYCKCTMMKTTSWC